LVWGKELFFDATKVEANAALDSLQPRFAVDEHLRELFATDRDEPMVAWKAMKRGPSMVT